MKMVKDVINKVQFDVHCTSEAIAGKVQREISNFTWSRINRVIDDLFKKANSPLLYKIDRIEIELGDITLSALTSSQVLEGLHNKLEEALQQKLQFMSREDRTIMTGDAIDWDILKCYLLNGDIPWWLDKSQDTDIQKLARRISQKQPELLTDLIRQHNNQTNVRERLMFLLGKKNNFVFEEDITETSDSALLLSRIESFKIENLDETELRREIVKELAKDFHRIELAGNFSWLTDYQRKQFRIYGKGGQRKLITVLKTHSLLQLGHLLFAPSAEIHRSDDQLKSKPKLGEVSFKKWQPPAAPALSALFKKWKEVNKKRVNDIKLLALHPGILRYDLLSLIAKNRNPFVNDYADTKDQEIVSLWANTHKLLSRSFGELTGKQLSLYQELIKHGYSGRRNEINTMKQLLQDLPPQSLKLITFLTDQINDEIKETDLATAIERITGTNQGTLVIENAGLCLIAPYLPSLFKELGYLDDTIFRTHAFAIRAILLLEYIVMGKRSNPEYRLQLNKILCACNIAEVVGGYKRFRKKEMDEADELIRAVIRNWKVLNNTSIGGFRESFLQRKGILTENETSWNLRVERKSYDMLLNSLPWSFNMIKLPWMTKIIEVEW